MDTDSQLYQPQQPAAGVPGQGPTLKHGTYLGFKAFNAEDNTLVQQIYDQIKTNPGALSTLDGLGDERFRDRVRKDIESRTEHRGQMLAAAAMQDPATGQRWVCVGDARALAHKTCLTDADRNAALAHLSQHTLSPAPGPKPKKGKDPTAGGDQDDLTDRLLRQRDAPKPQPKAAGGRFNPVSDTYHVMKDMVSETGRGLQWAGKTGAHAAKAGVNTASAGLARHQASRVERQRERLSQATNTMGQRADTVTEHVTQLDSMLKKAGYRSSASAEARADVMRRVMASPEGAKQARLINQSCKAFRRSASMMADAASNGAPPDAANPDVANKLKDMNKALDKTPAKDLLEEQEETRTASERALEVIVNLIKRMASMFTRNKGASPEAADKPHEARTAGPSGPGGRPSA